MDGISGAGNTAASMNVRFTGDASGVTAAAAQAEAVLKKTANSANAIPAAVNNATAKSSDSLLGMASGAAKAGKQLSRLVGGLAHLGVAVAAFEVGQSIGEKLVFGGMTEEEYKAKEKTRQDISVASINAQKAIGALVGGSDTQFAEKQKKEKEALLKPINDEIAATEALRKTAADTVHAFGLFGKGDNFSWGNLATGQLYNVNNKEVERLKKQGEAEINQLKENADKVKAFQEEEAAGREADKEAASDNFAKQNVAYHEELIDAMGKTDMMQLQLNKGSAEAIILLKGQIEAEKLLNQAEIATGQKKIELQEQANLATQLAEQAANDITKTKTFGMNQRLSQAQSLDADEYVKIRMEGARKVAALQKELDEETNEYNRSAIEEIIELEKQHSENMTRELKARIEMQREADIESNAKRQESGFKVNDIVFSPAALAAIQQNGISSRLQGYSP